MLTQIIQVIYEQTGKRTLSHWKNEETYSFHFQTKKKKKNFCFMPQCFLDIILGTQCQIMGNQGHRG